VPAMQSLTLALRSLPQVTIAKLRGRLRGGGNELAMAADLRYAAAGQTWLSQMESGIGIIPGGGGTQLLTRLVGRARAVEVVLGSDLVEQVRRAVEAGAQSRERELDLESTLDQALSSAVS
jgi:enoyl-CoA hydratase/carnithine racemase